MDSTPEVSTKEVATSLTRSVGHIHTYQSLLDFFGGNAGLSKTFGWSPQRTHAWSKRNNGSGSIPTEPGMVVYAYLRSVGVTIDLGLLDIPPSVQAAIKAGIHNA